MSEQTKAKLGAKLDDSPGAATSSLEFAITKPFVDVHSDRRLFSYETGVGFSDSSGDAKADSIGFRPREPFGALDKWKFYS